MHIAFLELIIDPACSLVFENEPPEADVMKIPPRDTAAQLFGGATLWLALLQGVGVLAVVMGAYVWSQQRLTEPEARALAFATLVFSNLALIFSNRSRTRRLPGLLGGANPILWIVTAATLGFLALSIYVPLLGGVFRFAPLSPAELALAFGLALFGVGGTWIFRRT